MGKRQLISEEQESASKQAKMGSEADSEQAKLAAVSAVARSRS